MNVKVRAHPQPRTQVVLIVDDEPDILLSIAALLQEGLPNVRCIMAESGAAGLQAMGKSAVDLVITDFRMPGMDGLEFLQRAKLLAPRVPRFLLTAYPDLSVAVRAINEAGIEQFITKPLDPKMVLDAVEGALAGRRAQEDRNQALARALSMRREV